MDIKKLYEEITKEMDAEHALMKLLEAHEITYENLGIENGEKIHPIEIITMAALDMGWSVVAHNDGDDIKGMTVGTETYVDKIVDNLPDKTKPIINIAVVGKNKRDVKDYLKQWLHPAAKRNKLFTTYVEVESRDYVMRYHIITRPRNIRGLKPDRVVETYLSRDNPEFHDIIDEFNANKKR